MTADKYDKEALGLASLIRMSEHNAFHIAAALRRVAAEARRQAFREAANAVHCNRPSGGDPLFAPLVFAQYVLDRESVLALIRDDAAKEQSKP